MGEGGPADQVQVKAVRQKFDVEQADKQRRQRQRREEAADYQWDGFWEEPTDVDMQSEPEVPVPADKAPVTPVKNDKKRPLPTGGEVEPASGSGDTPHAAPQKS